MGVTAKGDGGGEKTIGVGIVGGGDKGLLGVLIPDPKKAPSEGEFPL